MPISDIRSLLINNLHGFCRYSMLICPFFQSYRHIVAFGFIWCELNRDFLPFSMPQTLSVVFFFEIEIDLISSV